MNISGLGDPSSRATALVTDSLVWDNHGCLPLEDAPHWMPQLARYKASGFDVVHINIGDSDIPLERIVRTLASFRRWLSDHSNEYTLVERVQDITEARLHGRLAVCFDIEGAQALGENLALIAMFYDLGVRWMLIAYNCANLVGGGCHDAVDRGLTAFGRRFLEEMDRVGMIKDLAHTGYRTAMDVLEATRVPVTISHSNPRALNDHPRCVPDDLMKACAACGGVLGISGHGLFLGRNDISTANMVHSIDYSVQLMGIDHVGLGLDFVFDQTGAAESLEGKRHIWPENLGYGREIQFLPPERLTEIVEALLMRGYRDADVAKIVGGNFLRVANRVWK